MGYETFLRWAVHEVGEAEKAGTADDRSRFSINSVMHARRALSCLIDQYLQRVGFSLCRDAPKQTEKKVEVLVRRGIFDSLSTEALKRSVSRRNDAEHDYRGIELHEAQDTVQMIRATVTNSVAKSGPYNSPVLFGSILGGYGTSKGSVRGWFNGWSGSAFHLATFVQPPWVGIIVPSNQTEAVVRRVCFDKLSVRILQEALTVVESHTVPGSASSASPGLWEAFLRKAGIIV
jgi:hypothetical protein